MTLPLPYDYRRREVQKALNRNRDALDEVAGDVATLQPAVSSLQTSVGTRTSGAAASIGDGNTISHGLGSTPTWISVTGTVATEILSVTGKNSSTFTVAIKTVAGAAGTAQTVYWEAKA